MKTFKKLFCLSLVACSFCFFLAGCGNNDTGSTSGNNDNNVMDDTGEAVGGAAEDVADGVGNAVDDLMGTNGFERYEDAHKYFVDTMKEYHPEAKFEIRDIDFEVEYYKDGSKGYEFELYDKSKNEAGEFFGEFYVDATTGAIYKELDDDNLEEYTGPKGDTQNGGATKDNGANGNNMNGNGNNTNGGNNNSGNGNGGNGTEGGNTSSTSTDGAGSGTGAQGTEDNTTDKTGKAGATR